MSHTALEFELEPYESAGSIRFGMSSAHVRAQLGDHASVQDPSLSYDTFTELGVRVHYSSAGVVEAVEFRRPAHPTVAGRRLVSQHYGDLERWFASLDPSLRLEHSGLTSVRFGIRLYAASAQKHPGAPVEVVTVFDRDYCRRYLASIRPPPG